MANITEYLRQIQSLTSKNLELLAAINEAFITKKAYLNVKIDDMDFKIPSYLALESRITDLQEAFYNLVNVPKTGVASFCFNGNTQEIEVKRFTSTPPSITPVGVDKFDVKTNNIFKDMLSPVPFLKMDLSALLDDALRVNVKKVVIKSDECADALKAFMADDQASQEVNYLDVVDALYPFEKGLDYEVYDKIYDLPVRDNSRVGKWEIVSIDKNWQDENFEEHYILTLDRELTTIDDRGNITNLQLGDYVLCYDGKVKLQIEDDPKLESKQIAVKVLYGGYTNLVTKDKGQADLSTLEFFEAADYYKYKYIEVPIEEDRYIFLFLDNVNELNVKSVLSNGLAIDTYKLVIGEDVDNQITYEEYYKNVNNIGDKLESITNMFNNGLNVYSKDEYQQLIDYQPDSNYLTYAVKQINSHLNNNETVKNIRSLYSQKKSNKTELQSLQNEIAQLNELINNIDFNDTTGIRETYIQQLTDKQSQYESLQTNITNITNEISDLSNNSVTPIENAKYHLRGFIDVDTIKAEFNKLFETNQNEINPIKVNVLYRYRNAEGTSGNAMSISEDLLFSDWNLMPSEYNKKSALVVDGENLGKSYAFAPTNNTENAPSFNQVDIPFTQGEVIDLKFNVQYDLGYPFINVESAYSEMITIEFPEELQKDIEILDIINENNDEVKQHAFDNILTKYGVQEHVGNKVVDNDTTFWHTADNITSGFYTSEQRVISLKEKLNEINNTLTEVHDEVFGTNSNDLTVVLSNSQHSVILNDNDENIFNALDYISNTNSKTTNVLDDIFSFELANPNAVKWGNVTNATNGIIKLKTGEKTDEIFDLLAAGQTITLNNGEPIMAVDSNTYTVLNEQILDLRNIGTSIEILILNNGWGTTMAVGHIYKGDVLVVSAAAYKFDRINLQLQNNSKNSMKIFPLFFGEKSDKLTEDKTQYTTARNYAKYGKGIGIYTKDEYFVYQRLNQVLYFRMFDPYKTSYDKPETNWFYTNCTADKSSILKEETKPIENGYESTTSGAKYTFGDNSKIIWKFKVNDPSSKTYMSDGTSNRFYSGKKYNVVTVKPDGDNYSKPLPVAIESWYAGDKMDEMEELDLTTPAPNLPAATTPVLIDTSSVELVIYLLNNNNKIVDKSKFDITITADINNPVVNLSECGIVGHTNTPMCYTKHSNAFIEYDGEIITTYESVYNINNKISYNSDYDYSYATQATTYQSGEKFGYLYPYVNSLADIQLKSGNSRYYTLKAGESVSLGLMLEYFLTNKSDANSIEKTIAFDVRTSLYSEPHMYIVTVKAQYENNAQFEDSATNRYNSVIVN